MIQRTPVVDLFSGPGGLGEGFSSFTESGKQLFDVVVSVEKEASAAKTLLLRTFFRDFRKVPDDYYQALRGEISFEDLFEKYPKEYARACGKVWQEELGENDFTRIKLHKEIERDIKGSEHWVLIGGPPCQAYSTVGRVRNRGIKGYNAVDDKRHFLYREYLKVIEKHWPSVFIMENVPGLLTAKIEGESIFNRIQRDLEDPCAALGEKEHKDFDGYRLYSLVTPTKYDLWQQPTIAAKDFIVKSEEHGIPQSRHRVIILGVRSDIGAHPELLTEIDPRINTEDVIGDLPRLRSGLSNNDSNDRWLEILRSSRDQRWWKELEEEQQDEVLSYIDKTLSNLRSPRLKTGSQFVKSSKTPKVLKDWYHDPRLGGICNHEARSHMDSDLYRYLFTSCLVKIEEIKGIKNNTDVPYAIQSKLEKFPESLLPAHKNVHSADNIKKVHFANRFQVQRAKSPSSTIVSHIAKDGHYYIHYDPLQCRTLTVREAARLQTFPDNYFFCGTRTQQYTQVGNAVPPLLSRSIAQVVMNVLNDG